MITDIVMFSLLKSQGSVVPFTVYISISPAAGGDSDGLSNSQISFFHKICLRQQRVNLPVLLMNHKMQYGNLAMNTSPKTLKHKCLFRFGLTVKL